MPIKKGQMTQENKELRRKKLKERWENDRETLLKIIESNREFNKKRLLLVDEKKEFDTLKELALYLNINYKTISAQILKQKDVREKIVKTSSGVRKVILL
jgi:hypothetical protein